MLGEVRERLPYDNLYKCEQSTRVTSYLDSPASSHCLLVQIVLPPKHVHRTSRLYLS